MPFSELPYELRKQIIGDCFEPRKIEVVFRMWPKIHDRVPLYPWYVLGRSFTRAHITWEYELSGVQGDSVIENLSLVNKEFFQFVEEENSVWLRINGQGPPIRFRPAVDTIFMDCLSLYCLQHFAHAALYNTNMSWDGFDKIQSLETPLEWRPGNQSRVHSGLQAMRTGPTNVLAGLLDGKITPAHDYEGTMSDRWQVIDEIIDTMELLDSSLARPSRRQRDVITDEKWRIFEQILEFFQ